MIQTPHALYEALYPLSLSAVARGEEMRRYILFSCANDAYARRLLREEFQHVGVMDYFPAENMTVLVERTGLYWNTTLFKGSPSTAASEYSDILRRPLPRILPVPSAMYCPVLDGMTHGIIGDNEFSEISAVAEDKAAERVAGANRRSGATRP